MFRKIEFPCHLGSRGIDNKCKSFPVLTEFRKRVDGVLFIAYKEGKKNWKTSILKKTKSEIPFVR